jgi:putative ABC transport system substrate-binding protein
MKKKISALTLSAMLLALSVCAQAQTPGKVARIGYLTVASLSAIAPRIEAFRQGLSELGYIEGKTIVIEWRAAGGERNRLPALAAELVNLKVDLIVTGGQGATAPAKQATSTIPIIMTQDDDPVGNGFISSLARPGGNITGLSTLAPELSGKRLEILTEVVPKLSRVAVLASTTTAGYPRAKKEIERAADALRLKLKLFEVNALRDIEPAFHVAKKNRAEAILWQVSGPITNSRRKEVTETQVKSRLPVIHYRAEPVNAGGLMSYGVSIDDLDRRAATYVDKILKGRKPAELPVEQPTKFEFIINIKAARQIELTIPPNVLARADKVIR